MSQDPYYALEETIAAIATPVGAGGIGIVRLSGPEALPILRALLRAASGALAPRKMCYGHIVDPRAGTGRGRGAGRLYARPTTYTRQDVVEIHCHGGPAPLRRVLDLCLAHGARLAGPGEFTLRAFLNGRIDLAQAEAVADLVEAKTDAGLRLAVAQLEGGCRIGSGDVRARLLEALAWVEASVDFDEDEIPPYDIDDELDAARRSSSRGLIDGAERGIALPAGHSHRDRRPAQRGQEQPAQRPAARRAGDRDPHSRHHARHAGRDAQPARHPAGAGGHGGHPQRHARPGRGPGRGAQPRRAGPGRPGAAGDRRQRAADRRRTARSRRWWATSRRSWWSTRSTCHGQAPRSTTCCLRAPRSSCRR